MSASPRASAGAILARLACGAAAGIVATAVMSAAMLGAKRLGALGEPPPRRIVRRALAPLLGRGRRLNAMATVAHFAFGAGMGALFSLLPTRARRHSGSLLFGAAVWGVNYAGVLPSLGLMPAVRHDRLGRAASMLASHLVFGAALGRAFAGLWTDHESLRGKVVVVCGGSRGLGRAVARELCERGARVAICGRSADSLQRAQDWLKASGFTVFAEACDLRHEGYTRAFLARVERELGPIDVLLTNAATIDVAPIETLSASDFQAAMAEIFGAALHPILTVLPAMQARQRGTLAVVTSIGGKLGVPHLAPYSSAKFALVGFAEALQAEVAKDNIRVLTVVPGLMRTGSHVRATFRGDAEAELAWFGASATAPLVSISSRRAARHIVRALARGDRYATFTPAARLGARLHDLAPELFSALASVAGRLLPRGRDEGAYLRADGGHVLAKSDSRWLELIRARSLDLAAQNGQ